MIKFVGYALIFFGAVMLNVVGGINCTEWQWWVIAAPIALGASFI